MANVFPLTNDFAGNSLLSSNLVMKERIEMIITYSTDFFQIFVIVLEIPRNN